MKHLFISLLGVLCLLCSLQLSAQSITLNGVAYDIDTVSLFQAGPGATHIAVRMLTHSKQDKPLNVFMLRVDATNPYIHFEQILGKDKLVGAEKPSSMATRRTTSTSIVVGGSNGDFYLTTGDIGKPIGLTIENGEYALVGSTSRRLGGFDDMGKAVLGTNWSYSGKLILADTTLTIHHANYNRGENQLVLFNQHNGTSTNTNQYGTELLVELKEGEQWKTNGTINLKVVQKEENKGDMAIPKGKAVLSAHGTMATQLNKLQSGDEVQIQFSLLIDDAAKNLQQSIGGDNYALIVHNGQVEQENFWNEVHPRTGFGASANGDTVLFCIVDGRSTISTGCTTKVLGEIMQYYGAYNAVNWDGGGSSCLYINQYGQVNHGSDGTERSVANGMFAIADIPEEDNTISTIRPYDISISLPRYAAYQPHFYGYNKYDILLNTDVESITLQCDESLGTIMEDGRLLVSGTQSGYLNAQYGNATTKIYVNVLPTSNISFALDSILLDSRHNYQVEVLSHTDNGAMTVPSEVLQWSSNNADVCSVDDNGNLTAGNNGYASIVGNLQGVTDTLQVHVQNPSAPTIPYTEITAASLTGAGSFNPKWNGNSIVLQYAITRAPFVALQQTVPLYGLPDSIRIDLTTDLVLSDMSLSLTFNSNRSSFRKQSVALTAQTGNISATAPVSQWTGEVFNISLYPLWFSELRFGIDTKSTAGEHTITINGVTLCYKDVEITAIDNIYNSNWNIYPNPVENNEIHLQGVPVGSKVQLYSLDGASLMQTVIAQEDEILNLSKLSAGQYLLVIGDNHTYKILKK